MDLQKEFIYRSDFFGEVGVVQWKMGVAVQSLGMKSIVLPDTDEEKSS